MQKPKKNFVLLLGICLFSSCGSLPKKPKIELCAHNELAMEVECFDNQTQEYRSIPINQTDRYIMTSPDDWGLILLYIDRLQRKIRRGNLKRELNKILKTDRKIKGLR